MEPRKASSSSFPFAIRARLSTEDSASDASSFVSGDSSGRDESEEDDNGASFRRPFVPIARVTGEEEDDDDDVDDVVVDELMFDDGEWGNPKVADESFGVEGFVMEMERMGVAVDDDEWGKAKLEDERLVVDESFGVKGSVIDVEEKGYVEEMERMVVSIDDVEWGNPNLAAERLVEERLNSAFGCEVLSGREEKDDDLGVKGSEIVLDDDVGVVDVGLGLNDVKVEVDGSNLVHDVEEDLDSGAVVCEEIGADVEESKGFELELKDLVVELSTVDSEKSNLDGVVDSTQNSAMEGFFGEKILEASEAEANSTKLKLIHDSKAFELEYPEVSAIYMEAEKDEDLYRSVDSEKPKHFTGELLVLTDSLNVQGNDSPSTVVSTETTMVYLDNVNEKNDESRVEEISIAENYSNGEFSSDNLSPFYVCDKEMESRFDSFYFSLDEDSVEEDEHVIPEWPAMADISENSGFVKHILKEMEEDLSSSQTSSHILDGETISNSDQEEETYKYSDAKELFDTCALAALLRDSNGGSSGKVALFTSQDTSSVNDMDDDEMMLCSRVEQLRVKYLRLVEKLGHSSDDALPDHVLRQIGLIDLVRRGRRISENFNLKTAKKVIFQHDEGKHDFILSCTILVLGKTGVGKSAIINSIFGEERAFTDPFQPATTSVREISGLVDGVSIRFIDTPGLLTSLNDQRSNRNILSSIKKCIRRCPPDIVLYVDRLDAYNRDFNELPMLRMITNILGTSIWVNAIVALTHADSAFPDGPDGSSMSYDNVVVQRSKVVQQLIWQAAEDSRLVNPVALVENHSSCRKDMYGESILTNGLRWRPWLLLLCHSSKILSEVYSLMKHEIHSPQKLFPFHSRYPSPVLLSSNSSTYLGGDMDLDNLIDRPPSFKPPASKSRARKLTEGRKNAFLIRAGKRSGRRKSSED